MHFSYFTVYSSSLRNRLSFRHHYVLCSAMSQVVLFAYRKSQISQGGRALHNFYQTSYIVILSSICGAISETWDKISFQRHFSIYAHAGSSIENAPCVFRDSCMILMSFCLCCCFSFYLFVSLCCLKNVKYFLKALTV